MGTCLSSNVPHEIETLIPVGFLDLKQPKVYVHIKTAQFDYHGGIPTVYVLLESPKIGTYCPHPFADKWQHNHSLYPQRNAVLTPVIKMSPEWNEIVAHMRYSSTKIVRIQRVEQPQLWNRYWTYYKSLGSSCREVKVWHGTRSTQPSLIYNGGFKKEHSRIGGCLWYAVNSSYSMNGFQHNVPRTSTSDYGNKQLFLCLVAAGNRNDVKYIRGNMILNVYQNDATYPAYLITYI